MKTAYSDTDHGQPGWYIELTPLWFPPTKGNPQGHLCRPEILGPWLELPTILGHWIDASKNDHTLIKAPQGSDFISYHIITTDQKETFTKSHMSGQPSSGPFHMIHGRWVPERKKVLGIF